MIGLFEGAGQVWLLALVIVCIVVIVISAIGIVVALIEEIRG